MPQPQGFVDPLKPHHVCRLRNALYGLKQAPRAWYDQLRTTLIQWHFVQSKADSSMFYYRTKHQFLIPLVYVDDILLTGSSSHILDQFLRLHQKFVIRDLGDVYFFLGIQITRSSHSFLLSQATYANDLLTRLSLIHLKSAPTPMPL